MTLRSIKTILIKTGLFKRNYKKSGIGTAVSGFTALRVHKNFITVFITKKLINNLILPMMYTN